MLTTFSLNNLESLTPKGWKFWIYCQKYSDKHLEILHSITVLGGLENESGNSKNSSRILKTSCKTYKKFLLLDRVPLSI